MRIGEQQSTGWVYHLSDALGSVRQLTDGSGQITLARGYTPYGEPLWSQGTGQSAYGYTGEALDISTGLVFLRARYMNPQLGMFTSRDPWSGDAMRPGSMNGWNYVENNPIELTDPSGLSPFPVPPPVPPNGRRAVMEKFKQNVLFFPGSGEGHFAVAWQTLDAEINFVDWMVSSSRLNDQWPNNWWSRVNGYLTMSRVPAPQINEFIHQLYPCFKYSDLYWSWGGPFGGNGEAGDALVFVNGIGLEPGVKEWVYFVWFMDYAKESPYEVNVYDHYFSRGLFWLAHNTALREGVDRAVDARQQETYWEQVLTNYVLYNVLIPGDKCARNGGACININQGFLALGLSFYPWHYPADSKAIDWVKTFFNGVYELLWNVSPPDPNMAGAEEYRLITPTGILPNDPPWIP